MNRQLRDAAHHLRVLYAVELAHAANDRPKIDHLLAAVDPIEVMTLVGFIEGLAVSLPISGAEPSSDSPSPHAGTDASGSPRSSAPVLSAVPCE